MAADEHAMSARLAEVQQALAASQADLTRVERKRDVMREMWAEDVRRLRHELDEAKATARRWSDRYTEACRAGLAIQAELATARQELERLRNDSPPTRAGSREETL